MRHSIATLLFASALNAGVSTLAIAQVLPARSGALRALIIGVDDYRYVPRLKGAVADARDLEASLRKTGASDVRIMLDASATRGSILVEFESMVTRAQPGDLIFLSLSGHGAQEPERVKGSEPDGMDEVFLLAGFDPKSRERNGEKILDKEFNHFIKQIEDKGARVLFVADSCSGGGLARDVDPRAEEMSYRAVKYNAIEDNLTPVATRADAMLAHADFKTSNFLAATDKRSRIPEVKIPGIGFRGALSYAVARGLEGAADLNDDGAITSDELFQYVQRVSYQLSDQRQQIVAVAGPEADPLTYPLLQFDRGISVVPVNPSAPPPAPAAAPVVARPAAPAAPTPAPAAGATPASPPARPVVQPAAASVPARTPVAAAQTKPALPKPADAGPVRVASLDGQASRFTGLSMLTPIEVVATDANPDLVWDPARREALSGGDVIARNVDRNDLPSIIERTAVVRWLKLRAANGPQSVRMFPDDKLHRKGARVEIEISGLANRALILLNVAGDGTVQLLYPLGSDPPIRTEAQYRLQLQVREPFGADQVIAVTAARRLPELEQAIRQLDRRRNPTKILDLINQHATAADVLVGSAGLFTAP